MESFNHREKLTLSLYYTLGLTFAEIARIFEVSESRVCQIHTHAITKLRQHVIPTQKTQETVVFTR
ncbi:MAG: hypothetical protein A3G13_01030 [Candidatus Levybacteria bacterium RIFCSPLOWO2_12_FULL_37_7]|nr:MAG: hypothetical protein A3G13_01030 [Candidatus Levybacteria bacterium RIFCSPLOWO2_12_FULL_37_7]